VGAIAGVRRSLIRNFTKELETGDRNMFMPLNMGFSVPIFRKVTTTQIMGIPALNLNNPPPPKKLRKRENFVLVSVPVITLIFIELIILQWQSSV
jgi:hypothetical protein